MKTTDAPTPTTMRAAYAAGRTCAAAKSAPPARHHDGARRDGPPRAPRVHGRADDELHRGEGVEVERGHRRDLDARRGEAPHEVLREDRGRDAVEVRDDVDEGENAPDEEAAGAVVGRNRPRPTSSRRP